MLGTGSRLAVAYFVSMGFAGAYQPFFPVWLDSVGYSASAISLLVGLPIMLRVPAALMVGPLAELTGDRKRALILAAALAMACSYVFLFETGMVGVAVALSLLFVALGVTQPLTDALAMSGDPESRARFGQVRLWGTIGYGVASIATGWLMTRAGAGVIPVWMAVVLTVAFLWWFTLPRSPVDREEGPPQPPLARWFSGLPLLRERRFVIFAIGIGASQASHALLNGFASIHWSTLGYSGTAIGIFWGLGIAAEIVFLYFSRSIFRRFSPATLLLATCAVSAVRMALMAFDPPLPLLVCLQLTHGITFGAMALGIVHFINLEIPDRLNASAQGLMTALATGVISAAAVVASGPIYATLGAGGYLLMSLIALVGVAAALLVMRSSAPERR